MAENNSVTQDGAEKGCVLIADDSKIVRVSAKKMLSGKFDLIFAEDGEEAWEILSANSRIQAVFTDIRMPKLDGYGLIERIRQSDDEGIRNQPVIVITGSGEDEGVKQRVLELGASDFISKPFKAIELVARAEAHCRYKRDNNSLKKTSEIDLLTKTLNQEGLRKRLEKEVSFVNRHAEALSLVLFELDNAEELYKEFGKKPLDMIVKQVAATLMRSVRKEDSIGRVGVGQFLAILPVAKADGVMLLSRRICAAVKACNVTINQKSLQISMSAGIASAAKGAHVRCDTMMDKVQLALRQANKGEGERVHLVRLESKQSEAAPTSISIDHLLTMLSQNQEEIDPGQLQLAVSQLQPLIALLSAEQKQLLIGR